MFVVKLLSLICLHTAGIFVLANLNTGLEKHYYDVGKARVFFNEFQKRYHRKYSNKQEYNYRFQVFKKSLQDINRRNKDSEGEVYGITEFADITFDEFLHEHTGLKAFVSNHTGEIVSRQYVQVGNVPENWDWREQGVVTPVRHQGYCSSCWSFSAIGCVEGQYARKHGRLLTLSEQQLVDCYKKDCRRGDWPHVAFQAAAEMGGLMLAQDYPYISTYGQVGQCRFNQGREHVRVNSGQQYSVMDEEKLKKFLYSYGPLSIGINAAQGFLYYQGGIASAMHLGCRPYEPINHAVLLVGYGIENGVPYWIIKNSSGEEWGEQGFIRIKRGENTCNILSYVAAADVA